MKSAKRYRGWSQGVIKTISNGVKKNPPQSGLGQYCAAITGFNRTWSMCIYRFQTSTENGKTVYPLLFVCFFLKSFTHWHKGNLRFSRDAQYCGTWSSLGGKTRPESEWTSCMYVSLKHWRYGTFIDVVKRVIDTHYIYVYICIPPTPTLFCLLFYLSSDHVRWAIWPFASCDHCLTQGETWYYCRTGSCFYCCYFQEWAHFVI